MASADSPSNAAMEGGGNAMARRYRRVLLIRVYY